MSPASRESTMTSCWTTWGGSFSGRCGRPRMRTNNGAQLIGITVFQRKMRSPEDAHAFDEEIRVCDFLNRDHEGNYQFAHKSFLEFFVAQQVSEMLMRGETPECRLTDEIVRFVHYLIVSAP